MPVTMRSRGPYTAFLKDDVYLGLCVKRDSGSSPLYLIVGRNGENLGTADNFLEVLELFIKESYK